MTILAAVAYNVLCHFIGFWLANLFTRAVPVSPKFNMMTLTTLITVWVCQLV